MFDDDDYDDFYPEFYDNNETIFNSSLYSIEKSPNKNYFDKIFNNTSLKVGIIVKIYEIDDEKNNNKKIPEYDVLVVQNNKQESIEPIFYKNCINAENFGGKADFFEYKMRAVDKKETNSKAVLDIDFSKQYGNMVLLLCLDGSTDRGIIIKSVNHRGRKSTLTKDAGLHLEGEYNGLNWQVNKDGELTVTFKSKTDNEGKPQDETAGGSFLKIDKKGSVNLDSGLKEKEETNIVIDKEKKDVKIKAGQSFIMSTQKDIEISAEGKISGKAKASVEFLSEGTAKYTAKSSIDIEGTSVANIKGGNVIVSGQNGVIIEGQQCMIDTPKVFVGQGGSPAIIGTTKFVGTGNFGAPVICYAVGPFSKSVLIGS